MEGTLALSSGRRARRWAALLAVGSLLAGAVAAAAWVLAPTGPPPDLLLVVMDTVRADRMHLCGHGLPNTPVLDGLAAEGWQVSCDAVAPASWTLPSHLALFTGQPYIELLEGAEGPTLAESLQARGYDTALLSANTVLKKDERFQRGFRQVRVARTMAELKGTAFTPALEEVLDGADPSRPLFLVVNLVDAHTPYVRIPKNLGWLPPQPSFNLRRYGKDPEAPFARYAAGRMAPAEREAFEEAMRNGYDYGVFLTDRNVGEVLAALERRGRTRRARMVVTSDHGELLGEHSAIGHGDTLWEPGMRVPFLYHDTEGPDAPLPSPMSALQAHALLLDGAPSEAPLTVTNHRFRFEDAWVGAAVWTAEGHKLVDHDGIRERFDLTADPEERSPLPIGAGPDVERLDALTRRAVEHAAPLDDDTVELLKEAGYLAPD